MSISDRSLSALGSAPGIITIRTVPPVANWPDWMPADPTDTAPCDFRITADSLQFLDPAPGYRFRYDGAGTVVHEPV